MDFVAGSFYDVCGGTFGHTSAYEQLNRAAPRPFPVLAEHRLRAQYGVRCLTVTARDTCFWWDRSFTSLAS